MGQIALFRRGYFYFLTLIFSLLMNINAQDSSRYDFIYDQLMTGMVKDVKMAPVKDYVLQRGAAKFRLNDGRIYLLGPVDGRQISAVFKGNGSFWFSPPTQIERDQLVRFYETDTLEKDFKFLYLMFFDSSLSDLESDFDFSPDVAEDELDDIEKEVKQVFEYISDEDNRYFRTDVMKCLLEKEATGYFYAHLFQKEQSPMMYEINPFEKENIRLMHRAELGHIYKIPEIVCQFSQSEDYKNGYENNFYIKKFEIDAHISTGFDFSARAILHININRDNQHWLAFNIYHDMEIDSVVTSGGKLLTHFKPEEIRIFWVDLGRTLNKGDTLKLVVDYHCDDILHRDTRSWIYLKSPNYWYPRNAIWDLSEYELTFHYPEDITLISIGQQLSKEIKDDTVTAIWKPKNVVTHAAFNLGYFETYTIENDSLPNGITVLKTKQGLMFRSRDIEEEIAEDVTRSIKFYAQKYGEVPFDGLYVSEVPFPHGMAFKGMLNLAWSTFYQTGFYGYDQVFRAHEVAHQWWGIEVGFESYHDQWLSESFSEFSGIWYLQQLKDGKELFTDMMDTWHEKILMNRQYMFDSGQESGPIWLGVRTSSTQTAGDYDLIVYKKGAWVLHMLRMMLYDWQNESDVRFIKMMKDFYYTFKGRKASTVDFQGIVEKHIKMPMDWFFNQWIYGTEIPKYEYAIESEESDDETYRLNIAVRQNENQKLLQMPIPVEVRYDDDTSEYFIIEMEQYLVHREILLKKEPDDIIINPLHSVLAELEEVDMEDLDVK